MGRVINSVLVLAILGFAGLTAYAYLADMTPVEGEVTVPVSLHAD
jgi:NADPH-dependent curcumin reductase CurA